MSGRTTDEELTPDASGEVLEVMANPYRQRAYDTLLVFGDMTARKLARLTHLSEASLNRHMQQLQRIGFVRVIDADLPVRQRVWHAVRGGVRLGDISGEEEHASAAQSWFRSQIEAQAHVMQDWIDVSSSWPVEWRLAVERWDYVLKAVTVEQLEEIAGEMSALVAKWRAISEQQEVDGTPGTRTAYLVTHAVPWPIEYDALDDDAE